MNIVNYHSILLYTIAHTHLIKTCHEVGEHCIFFHVSYLGLGTRNIHKIKSINRAQDTALEFGSIQFYKIRSLGQQTMENTKFLCMLAQVLHFVRNRTKAVTRSTKAYCEILDNTHGWFACDKQEHL